MCCVPFQCGYIAKSEIKKVPHFGRWINRVRGIYINRGDARESLKTINEGVEFLKQGFSMVIFPEGTRAKGPDYELGEFHHGSFKLATKAKVPIVPVTINGTYKCYEETGVVQKHQSFDVTFHEMIDVAAMDRKEYAELPEKVRDIIKSAL
jgi:1-acyl-sn-glycerol-3-phosphate acyltransferase